MKTAAVIAEYNPFHNGHFYHLTETRRLTGADYLLVVMSGDFVQRGAPALCNKYLRTKMALLNGADAVLELPALYALSSAEFFAQGSICLLNALGVIDFLSFGSESGTLSPLLSLAGQLLSESHAYREALNASLKRGLSFPSSRANALAASAPAQKENAPDSPNDILGVEYCKALLSSSSTIKPVTIQRKGAGYHNSLLSSCAEDFSSASAIRNAICLEGSIPKEQLPETVSALLCESNILTDYMQADDFSSLLHYRLLLGQKTGFSEYLDCSPSLSDKISKLLPTYRNFTDFCFALKSKDLTYTRCSRVLTHILLNLKQPESYLLPLEERRLFLPYGRLLGFRREAAPLLSAIKKHSSIPLITKLADARKALSPDALKLLQQDIFCSDVYEAAFSAKTKKAPLNEYRQSPIIL